MMQKRRGFAAAVTGAASCLLLAACTNGPKDIRITSVSAVDFKDQPQLDYVGQRPRPSIPLSRIDFSTSTDLLALAKEHGYNVSFVIGPCSKDGVVDSGVGLGNVYWGKARIYSDTRESELPGYAEAIAKGPPFTYQAYAKRLTLDPTKPLCFTLAGGAMWGGGKLRSNDAVISGGPYPPSH
jgi:hypothetical protein